MGAVPSMLRIELIHPMLVHFPIGLLTFAVVFRGLSLLARSEEGRIFFQKASRWLLGFGVLSLWGALLSGDQAEGIVGKMLCDPTVAQAHETWAEGVTWGFTAFALLDVLIAKVRPSWVTKSTPFFLGIGFAAAAALAWTGHLGATLVYQQGAAVYKPSVECREFK